MGGPVVCYQNKYTIKSINSKDSIQARNLHLIKKVDFRLRNLYSAGFVNLSSKPKISQFDFMVDLNAQYTLRETNIWLQQCVVILRFYGTRGQDSNLRSTDSKSRILRIQKCCDYNQLILFRFFKEFLVSFGTIWKYLTLTGTIWAQFSFLQIHPCHPFFGCTKESLYPKMLFKSSSPSVDDYLIDAKYPMETDL